MNTVSSVYRHYWNKLPPRRLTHDSEVDFFHWGKWFLYQCLLSAGALTVGLVRQCQTIHGRDRTCIPPRLPPEWVTTLFFIIMGIISLTVTCGLLVASHWRREATKYARWIAFTGSKWSSSGCHSAWAEAVSTFYQLSHRSCGALTFENVFAPLNISSKHVVLRAGGQKTSSWSLDIWPSALRRPFEMLGVNAVSAMMQMHANILSYLTPLPPSVIEWVACALVHIL